MSLPEFIVCAEEPAFTKIGGLYCVMLRRCNDLTQLLATETQTNCQLLANRVLAFEEKRFQLEWKLPEDPESRLIEYLGVPVKFSKIRFAIMKTLIQAAGKPVSFAEISKAGWGGNIDKDVLHDSIYSLNKFLNEVGVPKILRCNGEMVHLESK